MTGAPLLVQSATGIALALGLALLCVRATAAAALVCAAQAAVVAAAALDQGATAAALILILETVALAWFLNAAQAERSDVRIASEPAERPTLQPPHDMRPRHNRRPPPDIRPLPGVPLRLGAAAVLAVLAAVGGSALPLAVVLLGLLAVSLEAAPVRQALGLVAAQNGLVVAALLCGLSGERVDLVALPLLPGAAFGLLWLSAAPTRIARTLAPRPATLAAAGLCGLALLAALTLPWQLGRHGALWRLDARAAHLVLLLCALAAAGSWARRDAASVWGGRLAILAGTILAVLASAPLVSWFGMAIAACGAAAHALPRRRAAWWRLRLAGPGLALTLTGTIMTEASLAPALHGVTLIATHAPAAAPDAAAMAMLGYGALAVLAPELAIAAVALILRFHGMPGLLPMLGLTALLLAAIGLFDARGRRRHILALASLAQGGVALVAFGLGTPAGTFAGWLQLTLLALTQCALLLARTGGLERLAASAGLAGVPPFGMFPGLALVLAATAAADPALLLPLGAGLAATAWPVLRHLPADRRPCLSPAWLPLALLLLAGFAMPAPVLAWLRLVAR